MKIKLSLIFATVLLHTLAVSANIWQDPETGVNYYYTNESNVATVKEGKLSFNPDWSEPGSSILTDKITIRSTFTVNGTEYVVRSIGHAAFYNCKELKSITIPNTITTIEEYAFGFCSNLTSITIPKSVTSIGVNGFPSCSNLTSIIVEPGNTKYDSRNNCNAIIETATNELLEGCKNTIIPNSVTSIGIEAFCSCSGLTSITIPNSVTSIGKTAFCDCTNLTSINIPNSVTTIDINAFAGCSSLASISIPNGVIYIGESAFRRCSSLASISIPNSVTEIGTHAFENCNSLISITVESGNTVYDSRDNCNAIVKTEDNTLFLGCKKSVIPNSVTSIGWSAFAYCSGLTTITIPNSVKSIGHSAFSGCSDLISITIPNSVLEIESAAFYGCSSLTSIDIPNSVSEIEDMTFANCSSLTSVTIPNSVWYIGFEAFYKCTGLTSITFPNSVTKINDGAFSYCNGLTVITIPNSVTDIGRFAFMHCSGLKEVYSMKEKPISIDENVFQYFDEDSKQLKFSSATLYVPVGSKARYQAADGWKMFTKIEEGQPSNGIKNTSPLIMGEKEKSKIFNLSGQRVASPVKGLYILDGKKIIIK